VRVTAEDGIVGILTGGVGDTGGSTSSGGAMGGASRSVSSRGYGGGTGAGGSTGNYTGSNAESPGDISVTASMEAGASTEKGSLSFSASGFAERTDYQTYVIYNSAAAGAAAGMSAQLGDLLSLRLSGSGWARRYENEPDRDGTGYSGAASLKQQVTDDLWLREAADYETYRAAYQDFSYRGPGGRFTMGYDLTDDLLVRAGYRFQTLHYQNSTAAGVRTGTASIGPDYYFSDHWSMGLLYERQTARAGTSDLITRNNMLTLSLSWDY